LPARHGLLNSGLDRLNIYLRLAVRCDHVSLVRYRRANILLLISHRAVICPEVQFLLGVTQANVRRSLAGAEPARGDRSLEIGDAVHSVRAHHLKE